MVIKIFKKSHKRSSASFVLNGLKLILAAFVQKMNKIFFSKWMI